MSELHSGYIVRFLFRHIHCIRRMINFVCSVWISHNCHRRLLVRCSRIRHETCYTCNGIRWRFWHTMYCAPTYTVYVCTLVVLAYDRQMIRSNDTNLSLQTVTSLSHVSECAKCYWQTCQFKCLLLLWKNI